MVTYWSNPNNIFWLPLPPISIPTISNSSLNFENCISSYRRFSVTEAPRILSAPLPTITQWLKLTISRTNLNTSSSTLLKLPLTILVTVIGRICQICFYSIWIDIFTLPISQSEVMVLVIWFYLLIYDLMGVRFEIYWFYLISFSVSCSIYCRN